MFSSREHLSLIFKVFLLGLATLVLSWLEIEELLELMKNSHISLGLDVFSPFPPTFHRLGDCSDSFVFSITRRENVGSIPFIAILLV